MPTPANPKLRARPELRAYLKLRARLGLTAQARWARLRADGFRYR